MTLNENSFSAKLYKWFYGEYDLPTQFCPYGRKIIFAYLAVIPYSLFCLPYLIGEVFDKDFKLGETETDERLGASFFIYICLLLLSAMGCSFFWYFGNYPKDSAVDNLGTAGLLIWFVIIVAFICAGVSTLSKKIKENMSSVKVIKTDNVIIEMIKAKKNKLCPTITWIKK